MQDSKLAAALEAMEKATKVEMEIPCPDCDGDGIERCDNPDHGFISAVGGEIGRLGCPCCGYDEEHRMMGCKCPTCSGTGKLPLAWIAKTKEELVVLRAYYKDKLDEVQWAGSQHGLYTRKLAALDELLKEVGR